VSKRKQPRQRARQIVRYHVYEIEGSELNVARIGTTLASDISQSGMFLSHASLTPGTQIHFYFELATGYIEAVGKVVHNRERIDDAGTARPGSGVRFIRMSERDRARLKSFLAGRSTSHRIPETRGEPRP
jgi:PilZ domain-containing protein